jgi:hypothetical protein
MTNIQHSKDMVLISSNKKSIVFTVCSSYKAAQYLNGWLLMQRFTINGMFSVEIGTRNLKNYVPS